MPNLDDINARLSLDTAGFTGPMAQAEEQSTASQRAIAREAKKAADAQAFASKFASDAVSKESLKIIEARKMESTASADYRKVQSLLRQGYVGEGEGATLAAAALQRLTKAKLESVAASKIQSAEEERVSIRFHEGGVGLGGTIAESAGGLAVLAAAAVTAEAMKKAVESSIEFGDQIQQASEKTGLAVGTLSTLHYAAAIVEVDFDKVTGAVSKMSKVIASASEGNKPAEALLKSLGLNADELAGRSDGAEIAFRKFASTLASTENPIRRVELATSFLGKAGAEQIPMLLQLGNNWDAFREKATAAGVQLDSKTIEQLAATKEQMADLKQHILGASLSFGSGFIPAFSATLGVIMGGESTFDNLNKWGELTGRVFAGLTSVFYSVAAGIEAVFALAEGGKLTAIGRRDWDAVDKLMKKAKSAHDLAYGDKIPEVKGVVPHAEGGSTGEGFTGTGEGKDASLAAAKKAEAERLKQTEAGLNAEKLIHSVSLKRAFDYWEQMKATFKAGSDGYNAIVAKQAEIAATGAAKAHDLILKSIAAAEHQPAAPSDPYAVIHSGAVANAKDQAQDYVNSNQLNIDDAHNKMMEQTAILADAAGDSMTRYAVAVELAKEHELEYKTVHASLESILAARIDADNTEHTKETGRAVTSARIALANHDTDHRIQQISDSRSLGQDSTPLLQQVGVGAADALNEFVLASRDAATQMRDIVSNTLNGLNEQIANGVTGGKTNFSSVASGAAKGLVNAGLQHAEGSLLSAMGFGGGKLGTKTNPMYTISMGLPGIPDASGIKGIGGFFSKLFGGLGHHANGGVIDGPAWVGELGPEIWMPPAPGGQIIPNYAINSGGGSGSGGTNINYQIDAKGTDPVQTEMRVKAAIAASTMASVSHSIAQQRDQARRVPGRAS